MPLRTASDLLALLRAAFERGSSAPADELLLFLYRLRDGYRIERSSSRFVSGHRFTVLSDLIHSLEADPEQALRSTERQSFILGFLSDIVEGRIVVRSRP